MSVSDIDGLFSTLNTLRRYFYRPHPKDGEGDAFCLFCQFTPGGEGGVPHLHPIILPLVSCPFWGYPNSIP